MANKKFWLGILIMVLVFGMTVVGCDNGSTNSGGVGVIPGGGADIWTDVTSLSQLNGTWKSSSTETETEDEGITMEMVYEITMTINASAGTMSMSEKTIMTFSGSSINMWWPMLKQDFSGEDGVTINDSNHSVTWTGPVLSEPISLSENEWQINQNGTKLKVMDAGEEIIFTKQ